MAEHSDRRHLPLLPTAVGIGLRAAHAQAIDDGAPAIDWLEIHSENYFAAGGPQRTLLRRLRERYPVSAHGVGASLGSADGLDPKHLAGLAELIDWLDPVLVSEHLSWGAIAGVHSNDLLPLPYTDEALAHMVNAVDEVQERLARRILIENVSSYVEFAASTMPEWEFLAALATRTGCGLLLDINNIDVSARNHGLDPHRYIDAIPRAAVQQFHLAGHSLQCFGDTTFVVDTHDQPIAASTWRLFDHALRRFGPRPVMIEWDTRLPPLAVLEAEVARARDHMAAVARHAA